MKKAFITGITGQDGSYLTEYLLERNYEVHGLVTNRSRDRDDPLWRLQSVLPKISLHEGTVDDADLILPLIRQLAPDECYHLAAESFVVTSPEEEMRLMRTNVNGTHHVLSALARYAPRCRFFFAGSSEMFGNAESAPQDETTPFNPRSLYGVTKVMGHTMVRYHRNHHNLFACAGILYNHESPRRSPRFVTRKITLGAAKIKLGLENELRLGNIETERDWGFAGDYAAAMHAMLTADTPEDFVIATGRTHTVREFLELAFSELGLDYQPYVVIDPDYYRPGEQVPLVGSAARAREKLGWQPRMNFEDMVRQMVRSDLELLKNQ